MILKISLENPNSRIFEFSFGFYTDPTARAVSVWLNHADYNRVLKTKEDISSTRKVHECRKSQQVGGNANKCHYLCAALNIEQSIFIQPLVSLIVVDKIGQIYLSLSVISILLGR